MNDLTELDDSKAPAPAPADELISRHFDEPLPPEDHGRLTRLLHEDPQALLDFVATARLHQALESQAAALRPLAAPGKRKRPLGWRVGIGVGAAAAAAALVAGGGWWIFARPEPADPHPRAVVSVRDIGPPPAEEPGKPESSSLKKRIVKVAGAAAPNMSQEELGELLERYYVNVTPHGLTVPKALEQLKQAIAEVNILNRPAVNQLRFQAGEAVEGEAGHTVVLTPLTPPMTVKAYLETCGSFWLVLREPGHLGYFYVPRLTQEERQFEKDGPLITKVFAVPADFLSSLPRTSAGAADAVADPFQNPAKEDPKWTAWEAVNEFFVKADEEGATAAFSEQSSKLVMRALPATLDRLDARLNSYLVRKTIPQVFITTKICSFPRSLLPTGFDEASGLIMTDPDFQKYMRFLSQQPEVNLFTAPSVVARSGQAARLEIEKEVVPASVRKVFEKMGLNVELKAQHQGEFMKLEGSIRMGILGNEVIPDSSVRLPMELQEPEASDGKVHGFTTEYDLTLPDRDTALFTLDVPLRRDLVAVVAITTTQIDPYGQPLNAQRKAEDPAAGTEIPYGIPAADKPGFVMSPYQANGMVDVAGIASGTKVMCPYTRKPFRVP